MIQIYAIISICAALLGGLVGYQVCDASAEAEIANLRAEHASVIADAERRSREAVEAVRAEEAALRLKQVKEVDRARMEVDQQRGIARAARVELERLRYAAQAIADDERAASAAPPVAGGGDAASGPGLVPTVMLGSVAQRVARLGERAVELAELARSRAIAGNLCVALSGGV